MAGVASLSPEAELERLLRRLDAKPGCMQTRGAILRLVRGAPLRRPEAVLCAAFGVATGDRDEARSAAAAAAAEERAVWPSQRLAQRLQVNEFDLFEQVAVAALECDEARTTDRRRRRHSERQRRSGNGDRHARNALVTLFEYCTLHLLRRCPPAHSRVRRLYALRHERERSFERADRLYAVALEDDPCCALAHKRRAAVLRAQGRVLDAASQVSMYLGALRATDVEAWLELGELAVMLGDFARARFCYEEVACVLAPNNWAYALRLADVLYAMRGSGVAGPAGRRRRERAVLGIGSASRVRDAKTGDDDDDDGHAEDECMLAARAYYARSLELRSARDGNVRAAFGLWAVCRALDAGGDGHNCALLGAAAHMIEHEVYGDGLAAVATHDEYCGAVARAAVRAAAPEASAHA